MKGLGLGLSSRFLMIMASLGLRPMVDGRWLWLSQATVVLDLLARVGSRGR